MLVDEVVEPGWLTEKQFFQGFALVQVSCVTLTILFEMYLVSSCRRCW